MRWLPNSLLSHVKALMGCTAPITVTGDNGLQL